jgi:hypothetical protein
MPKISHLLETLFWSVIFFSSNQEMFGFAGIVKAISTKQPAFKL